MERVVRVLVGGAAIRMGVGPCAVSDQSADDLVEGLGLAGLVVEPSAAAADQGTADDGTRPEGAPRPNQ
jgi:hypothetical protein